MHGHALGFGALHQQSSDVLEAQADLNRGISGGVGGLENIREEVYLSRGGAADPRNMHIQDHGAEQLIISPTSS